MYYICTVIDNQPGLLYERETMEGAIDIATQIAMEQCERPEAEIREELKNDGDFLGPNSEFRVCILTVEEE
jgi:hypothetical protein